MANKYDAIIVGSGLGGLSTAATLARRGLKTLLLEQHTQPGGYATTFFRDRYEFEVSLHALSGIGTKAAPGPLFIELDEMDVARRVTFLALDELYRSTGPDWDFVVPAGVAAYQDALAEQFPHEANGLKNVINQVLTIGYEVDLLRDGGHSKSPLPTLMRYPNLVHAAGVPLSHLLDRELSDPLAKLAVAQIWSYFALPPSRLSLLMFAAGLNSHLLYGSAALEGKSQSLSNAFVDVIREAGGDVAFSKGVSQILVKEGRVAGVETVHGDQIEADMVVANVNPITTLTKLVPQQHVPTQLLRRLHTMPPGLGAINLYLGLSTPSRELGITDYEVCINGHADLDAQYQSCLTLAPPENLTLCAYDISSLNASPEGTGLVNITALSDGRIWSRMDPAKYIENKTKMTNWILQRVSRIYPKLEGAVETLSVSTPMTNMRYTGNPEGAIYGFANTPALNPGFRLEPQGPIPGLFFAGAWTQPGGGYQATISSGRIAAEAVIKEMEKAGAKLKNAVPSNRIPQDKPPRSRFRRIRGIAMVLKDGKTVKATLAEKYRKADGDEAPRCAVARMVKRFYADDLPIELVDRIVETSDAVTLRFVPKEGHRLPPFVPGQYFSVKVSRNGISTRRAYSASSSPVHQHHLDITVKRQPNGDVSRYLVDELKTGERIEICGPFGDFTYNPFRDKKEILGIAVGSGITPFMSMISAFESMAQPPKLTLVYGSRRPSDIIFYDRLRDMAEQRPFFDVIPVLTEPVSGWSGETGRIDFEWLNRHQLLSHATTQSVFLCAPRGLYTHLVPKLMEAGIPRGRIRIEAFGPPEDVTNDADWPKSVAGQTSFIVHLQGINRPIHAMAGVPLLDSLEKAGIHPPAHCRAGVCDGCRVEVVSGEVFTPSDEMGNKTGLSGKRIQSCMSYPISDLSLID